MAGRRENKSLRRALVFWMLATDFSDTKRVAWALNRAQTATNLGALSAHSPCEPDLAVAELVDAALRRTTFVL
jgi:hypothetical protein